VRGRPPGQTPASTHTRDPQTHAPPLQKQSLQPSAPRQGRAPIAQATPGDTRAGHAAPASTAADASVAPPSGARRATAPHPRRARAARSGRARVTPRRMRESSVGVKRRARRGRALRYHRGVSLTTVGAARIDAVMLGAAGLGVVLLVAPVPGFALDALLALNLGGAVLLAAVSLRARGTAPLRALPSALLLATVARLALEVAATRAILTRGDVGSLIPAVGRVALGGDWGVGVAVFTVLVGVQYLVVARGAERVAEVAARFALDALPGRQMSLDAAVRGGLLDATAAANARERLADESAFHAGMDGAMKFVRGDALAGALIAAVNLVGGAALGASRGMSLSAALSRYGALAVGQGLLAQVPSLITAVAAALAVTRARGDAPVGASLASSLLGDRPALLGAAALLAVVGLLPGLPVAPFALAGAALAVAAHLRGAPAHGRVELRGPLGRRDALALVADLRAEAARALRCDPPTIVSAAADRWAVRLDGVEAARCDDLATLRREALALLVTRPSRWFGLDEARAWLDAHLEHAPAAAGAVVPGRLSLVELTDTLRALLDGGAPLAPGRALLDRLATAPRGLHGPALTEYARVALGAALAERWAPGGVARALEVSALLSDAVVDASAKSAEFSPGPSLRALVRDALAALPDDAPTLVVSSAPARGPLERVLRAVGSERTVVSYAELGDNEIERAGVLGGQ
jgi:type III secretion protein V